MYLMRDPIERAISQHRFEWFLGADQQPFSQALTGNPQLVDNGRYAFQLKQWLDYFPPEQFVLVFAEAFMTDPEPQVARVLDLLRVPHDAQLAAPAWERSNETSTLVRPSLARRLLRDSALGSAIRPYVPAAVTTAYRRRLDAKSKPEVSDADRAHLAALFDVDLEELTRLTSGPGITCASWRETSHALGSPARPF